MGTMVEKVEQEEEEEEDYSLLKDLKLEIKGEDGTFSICFWIYLTNSTPFPSTLLHQVHSDNDTNIPFLVFDENKKMLVFPLLYLHKEAPTPTNTIPIAQLPTAASSVDFPLAKWVHVGCEVAMNFVRLYIDGEIAGEKSLACVLDEEESSSEDLRKIALVSTNGSDADGVKGYVYGVQVFPLTSSIKDYHVKNPPLQLSVDSSSASEIEVDTDGVWSIIGGKASCRRNFSLDVILVDAFGQPVDKDMEVVASLLFADNDALVEKPNYLEAPLLTSYDGIEFASLDRPSKLINGRATFKLKISQLSSKCDNRLFRIRFNILGKDNYPFLEAFSHSIRCISRNRNARITSSFTWKKIPSGVHILNGSHSSPLFNEGSSQICEHTIHESRSSPPSKRVKLGQENPFVMFKDDKILERPNGGCCNNSHPGTSKENNNCEGTDNSSSSSDSESSEATDSFLKSVPSNATLLSDLAVFKYCLGGIAERSLLLKQIAGFVSEQQLMDFAQQVSLYSGCLHHRHQIIVSKRLIEDGIRTWNLISQDNDHLLWNNLVSVMKDHFKKISGCTTRTLVHQDFELLRRIGGCQDIVTRESFEKIWCWIYPVGVTLSQDWINSMWDSVTPKWIEGFITKEEAESSLQGIGGIVQDPGTFVLRFPTSRSWPHPDAGNLIVTYVGTDYRIHHKLLSVDLIHSSNTKEHGRKRLQEMLLEEPELSLLGRIVRSF